MDNVLCLCVTKDMEHTAESCLSQCSKCGCEVWVSLKNLTQKLICIKCSSELVKKQNEAGEEVKFMTTREDVIEAMEHIRSKNDHKQTDPLA